MSKHTPGPWTIADDNGTDIGIIARKRGRGGQMVAMVTVDEDVPQDDDERLANARLIAAAPDLLAACKAFAAARKAWRECDDMSSIEYLDTLDAIDFDAAIAKAEGGEV